MIDPKIIINSIIDQKIESYKEKEKYLDGHQFSLILEQDKSTLKDKIYEEIWKSDDLSYEEKKKNTNIYIRKYRDNYFREISKVKFKLSNTMFNLGEIYKCHTIFNIFPENCIRFLRNNSHYVVEMIYNTTNTIIIKSKKEPNEIDQIELERLNWLLFFFLSVNIKIKRTATRDFLTNCKAKVWYSYLLIQFVHVDENKPECEQSKKNCTHKKIIELLNMSLNELFIDNESFKKSNKTQSDRLNNNMYHQWNNSMYYYLQKKDHSNNGSSDNCPLYGDIVNSDRRNSVSPAEIIDNKPLIKKLILLFGGDPDCGHFQHRNSKISDPDMAKLCECYKNRACLLYSENGNIYLDA